MICAFTFAGRQQLQQLPTADKWMLSILFTCAVILYIVVYRKDDIRLIFYSLKCFAKRDKKRTQETQQSDMQKQSIEQ
jgi:hypothetical protein